MDTSQRRELNEGFQRSAGSFELVFGAALFALLGLLVDNAFGLTPLFTLVFAAMGFFGACVSLFYRYRHQMAQLDRGRAT